MELIKFTKLGLLRALRKWRSIFLYKKWRYYP
ncbi:MAG: hypothetical protein ACI9KI_001279, partial [Patiriisocius sp.]